MSKVIIGSYKDLEKYLGKEVGVSGYTKITQEQINKFADATHDHQWIHTDPEKAKTDSPFGTTIAHGYLTLSLLPNLWDEIVEINNLKMMINYGIDKLKFGEAVKVNDEVRIKAAVHDLTDLRGITRVKLKVKMEIKGQKKPAFDIIVVFLYHFYPEVSKQ